MHGGRTGATGARGNADRWPRLRTRSCRSSCCWRYLYRGEAPPLWVRRPAHPRSPIQHCEGVQWPYLQEETGRRVPPLVSGASRSACANDEAGRDAVRVLGLEHVGTDLSRPRGVVSRTQPNHLGTGQGPRCEEELEEQHRRHMVLHQVGGILLRCGCGEAEAQGACTLPGAREAEGLVRGTGRKVPSDPPVEHLDRHHRAVLVDAGEHRPSNSEARETDGEADAGELEDRATTYSIRSSAAAPPRSSQKSSHAAGAESRSMPSTSAWHSSGSPPPGPTRRSRAMPTAYSGTATPSPVGRGVSKPKALAAY